DPSVAGRQPAAARGGTAWTRGRGRTRQSVCGRRDTPPGAHPTYRPGRRADGPAAGGSSAVAGRDSRRRAQPGPTRRRPRHAGEGLGFRHLPDRTSFGPLFTYPGSTSRCPQGDGIFLRGLCRGTFPSIRVGADDLAEAAGGELLPDADLRARGDRVSARVAVIEEVPVVKRRCVEDERERLDRVLDELHRAVAESDIGA